MINRKYQLSTQVRSKQFRAGRLLRAAAFFFTPVAGILALLLAGPAVALSGSAAAVYEHSHIIPTNIKGVTGFPDLPAGFDAVNASDEELARYGMPPRPGLNSPDQYAKWKKAMSLIGQAKQFTGPLRDTGLKNLPMKLAGKRAAAVSGQPTQAFSSNWSGVANTIPSVTAWSSTNSFALVVSEFNVPVAQQAFGYCDGGADIQVSWNGIDGFSNGDVLQGGSLSQASCISSVTTPFYCGWVEWFPTTSVICEFGVNPGDDMFVETWDTSPTNGYVLIYDLTQNIYGVENLQATVPPFLVGNSVEFIVERPCCVNGSTLYPLANYVQDYWASSFAFDFSGNVYVPYDQSSNTQIITMLADDNVTAISSVPEIGVYQLQFADENCAYSGGCTP